MQLVSCRRQGPTPDPKCELNVTSFLTLSHQLHWPICAKDIMVAELLLHVMGDGKDGVGSFMLQFGWGDKGVGIVFFLLLLFCC